MLCSNHFEAGTERNIIPTSAMASNSIGVFKGYGKDASLLTLLSYNVGVVDCLATASKATASCFARLSKGIGTATKSTYPFATTKARSCEGCSDVGRQSLCLSNKVKGRIQNENPAFYALSGIDCDFFRGT